MDEETTELSLTIDLPKQLEETVNTEKNQNSHEILAKEHYRFIQLNHLFFAWKLLMINTHKYQTNELKVTRTHIRNCYRQYFTKWKSRFDAYEKVRNCCFEIRLSRIFYMWRSDSDRQLYLRAQFLKVILVRKQILERNSFRIWKRSHFFISQYQKAGEKSDSKLMRKVLHGLIINISLEKQLKFNEEKVCQISNYYNQIVCFHQWRLSFRFQILTKVCKKRTRIYKVHERFVQWRNQYEKRLNKRNRILNLSKSTKLNLVKTMFHEWRCKFCILNDIYQKEYSVQLFLNHNFLQQYFSKWLSSFNLQSYLSNQELDFLEIQAERQQRKYFSKWRTYFNFSNHKHNQIRHSKQLMFARIVRNYFGKWHSKYTESVYLRALFLRGGEELHLFLLKRNFRIWRTRTFQVQQAKDTNKAAQRFRKLSLELKAFSRLRIFSETQIQKRELLESADVLHEIWQMKKAMHKWNTKAYSRRRLIVMTKAVLKLWAFNLKKNRLNIWRSYVLKKKKKREEIQEALASYQRMQIGLALTAFTFVPNRPTVAQPKSFVDEESVDLLASPPSSPTKDSSRTGALESRLQVILDRISSGSGSEEDEMALSKIIAELNTINKL